MKLTNRNVNLVLMGGMALLTVVLVISQLLAGDNQSSILSTGFTALVLTGLFFAYWRGWDYARYAVVALVTLATAVALPEPFVTREQTFAALVAPVLALILTGPAWVAGSLVVIVGGLLIRAGGVGVYTQIPTLVLLVMLTAGNVLSRIVTDAAQRAAEENAARAAEALAEAEAQRAEISQKAEELARQNDEQRRLIDLVATLEVPAVAIADGVLLAPVVGHLDSRRATALTDRLLREVNASRARLVILDLAGVPAVDTAVAQAVLRAIQAVRLLGCDVTVTGISAGIAATMTQLGISMAGVRTARTPQEALGQSFAPAAISRN